MAFQGEKVIITKAGRPVAKLVAVKAEQEKMKRVLGCAKGDFSVPEDFNAPLPKALEDTFWH